MRKHRAYIKDLTSIGVFGGIGSGLLGAEWAGFKPVYNHEPRDFFESETWNYNFPNVDYSNELNPIDDIPTLMVGNPSCNIFSSLSTRKKHEVNSDTIKDTDFFKASELIDAYKPSYFIIENIPRILNHLTVESSLAYFNDLPGDPLFKGYHLSHAILNSYHFGVPQKRKRLFIVGALRHGPVEITLKRDQKPGRYHSGKTVGDAFEGLDSSLPNMEEPKHSLRRKEGFSRLKPGESYYGTQNNRKLFIDKPSGVVTSSCSRAVHPTEPRTLTVRETARLMGYPDDFKFFGGSTSQLDQVGKAIVPQVVLSICLNIRSHMNQWDAQ